MQQTSLRHEAIRYIKNNRKGSHSAKLFREHVIGKLIEDLFIIGHPPIKWSKLNNNHLKQLTKLWHKQRLKTATILNHLSIIKQFLQDMGNTELIIEGHQLGLQRKSKRKKPLRVLVNFWENITDPIAKTILGLQTHFGLTQSEAIRIKPQIHTRADSLWLTREISFNSLDRVIPYRTDTQINLIENLTKLVSSNRSLLEAYGYQFIKYSLRQSLLPLNMPRTKSWRYLYAQWLYQELKDTLSQYKLNWLIMDEMGLKSRTSLWKYLNEQ